MRIDTWNAPDDLRYDRALLADLTSLRFLDEHQSAIVLGPVGVGKTHLATALGHMAIRRRHTVSFARADKLFTRLRAARLDNTVDAEIRRLSAIDVLIIDDFALRPLDATETSDFYEIVVQRHHTMTTIVTSNREVDLLGRSARGGRGSARSGARARSRDTHREQLADVGRCWRQ